MAHANSADRRCDRHTCLRGRKRCCRRKRHEAARHRMAGGESRRHDEPRLEWPVGWTIGPTRIESSHPFEEGSLWPGTAGTASSSSARSLTAHSSFCSRRMTLTSLTITSLGKTPTSSVRRLISPLRRGSNRDSGRNHRRVVSPRRGRRAKAAPRPGVCVARSSSRGFRSALRHCAVSC
jgi:hypothetical protein